MVSGLSVEPGPGAEPVRVSLEASTRNWPTSRTRSTAPRGGAGTGHILVSCRINDSRFAPVLDRA